MSTFSTRILIHFVEMLESAKLVCLHILIILNTVASIQNSCLYNANYSFPLDTLAELRYNGVIFIFQPGGEGK
jgi:hypothetical protein